MDKISIENDRCSDTSPQQLDTHTFLNRILFEDEDQLIWSPHEKALMRLHSSKITELVSTDFDCPA